MSTPHARPLPSSVGTLVIGGGLAGLSSALNIDLTAQAAYDAVSDSCLIGSGTLYADLVAEASGSADASAMATAAVDGRADFRDSVMLAATDLEAWLGSSTSSEAAVMAMLAADGSFIGQPS
ncbi:MAG: hypothetical protein ACI8S6_002674 [Myxococcota bacterium]|jgi:hypothetical protein